MPGTKWVMKSNSTRITLGPVWLLVPTHGSPVAKPMTLTPVSSFPVMGRTISGLCLSRMRHQDAGQHRSKRSDNQGTTRKA